MELEAVSKQMKALKAKARAARKDGKDGAADAFRAGAKRLQRKVKAAKIRAKHAAAGQKKEEAPAT